MAALTHYYLLIATIFAQSLFIKRIGKKTILFLIGFELWFLSAFRSIDIGTDTRNYVNSFIESNMDFADVFFHSRMEAGYQFFTRIASMISDSPQMILIATSTIIIIANFFVISRYAKYAGFTVMLFLISMFGTTLSLLRQELALSIVLISLPFLIKRDLVPWIIGCIIASYFHFSAISIIPLYYLYDMEWKKKNVVVFIVSFLAAFILLPVLINIFVNLTGRYAGYVGGSYVLGNDIKMGSIIATLFSFIFFIFEVYTYKKYKEKINQYKMILPVNFLLFTELVSFFLYFISLRAPIFSRISLYYNYFSIFSLPVFCNAYFGKKKALAVAFVVGGLIARYSVILVFRPGWNHWLPYSFCFSY